MIPTPTPLDFQNPRVRIAPSPTGNLHIGTARTALFNYLFAKNAIHNGQNAKFILRIEDTDVERSEAQYVDNIFAGLRQLGLNWDEGPDVGGPFAPYSQMERLDTYKQFSELLFNAGMAYYCYKTADELDADRKQAEAEKRAYVYQRPNYTPEQVEQFKADPSRKPSLRFKLPDDIQEVVLNDIIRGEIKFDPALLGDFVIMKNNGTPTYNFACVVDDWLMQITHVIRGEDHISNTPRQILLYQAFSKVLNVSLENYLPKFAHVGMILAPDRTKLSKRQGATGIAEFITEGYLPEALCNFLSLLGWAPPEGHDIGTLEAFSKVFHLEKVAHSPAVFDKEKLNFLNSHYMRQLPLEQFEQLVLPYLEKYDVTGRYNQAQRELLWKSVREPMILLGDITSAVSYFFEPPTVLDDHAQETLFSENVMNADAKIILDAFLNTALPAFDFSSSESVGVSLKAFTKPLSETYKMKQIMWTLRAALTGRVHGADLSVTLYLLGQSEISSRVERLLQPVLK